MTNKENATNKAKQYAGAKQFFEKEVLPKIKESEVVDKLRDKAVETFQKTDWFEGELKKNDQVETNKKSTTTKKKSSTKSKTDVKEQIKKVEKKKRNEKK